MQGQALHIGINYCNPRDLADCQLDGAIPDARALRDATDWLTLHRLNGDGTLLEDKATEAGILEAMRHAAKAARPGELLMITFSGLGVGPDRTNTLELALNLRGWVTYDRRVVDVKEILAALSAAPKGATVVVVSACCFIGPRVGARRDEARISSARYDRALRPGVFDRFAARAINEGPVARADKPAAATVYHLAACGINQTINDGTAAIRSPFVGTLIELMAAGIDPPFDALVAELANRIDPDPQLEKFPDDPLFSSSSFLEAMGLVEFQPV